MSHILTDQRNLDWWIVSAGPKDEMGDILSITCEDLVVWDGFKPLFVVTRPGTELRDWFTAQGVDVSHELDKDENFADSVSIFRIRLPHNIEVLARLTFPSGRGG